MGFAEELGRAFLGKDFSAIFLLHSVPRKFKKLQTAQSSIRD